MTFFAVRYKVIQIFGSAFATVFDVVTVEGIRMFAWQVLVDWPIASRFFAKTPTAFKYLMPPDGHIFTVQKFPLVPADKRPRVQESSCLSSEWVNFRCAGHWVAPLEFARSPALAHRQIVN
jgi:hypothetical protein